jgi:hypothetical protein
MSICAQKYSQNAGFGIFIFKISLPTPTPLVATLQLGQQSSAAGLLIDGQGL